MDKDKKRFPIIEYILWVLIWSLPPLAILLLKIGLFSRLPPGITEHQAIVLMSMSIVLGYAVSKIISVMKKSSKIKCLPIGYQFAFYGLQYLMMLDNVTGIADYSKQIPMLTMSFIGMTVVDKLFDTYHRIQKEL